MRNIRSQTKVIATLGPSSGTKEIMLQMIEEGTDVFRLNFSHGSHEMYAEMISAIQELNSEYNLNIAILADLQGPKLRVGQIQDNVLPLADGDIITFVTHKCIGTKEQIYISYPNFPADVSAGETILVDDGKIQLEIIETNQTDSVRAKVIHGGILSSRKGVNLPDTKISLPGLSSEDIQNAIFAIQHQVDWIALSFVRKSTDVLELKKLISEKNSNIPVIAKIEKPEALNDLDNIIDVADGIMVARGDLGVELSFEKVPLIQKKIVQACINKAKPVIIATQMMESMIQNFTPTRAEANDVANAVLDGADALMLSGETSVGKYPVETIRCMQQIIDWTENNGFPYFKEHAPVENTLEFLPDSICYHACNMAHQTKASTIVTFSNSGYTAYRISSHRPEADIFAFTTNTSLLRRMSLVWGVRAFLTGDFPTISDAIDYTIEKLKANNLVQSRNVIIHVGSIPLQAKGYTNMLKISYI